MFGKKDSAKQQQQPSQAQLESILDMDLTLDLTLRMNATCSKICSSTAHNRSTVLHDEGSSFDGGKAANQKLFLRFGLGCDCQLIKTIFTLK